MQTKYFSLNVQLITSFINEDLPTKCFHFTILQVKFSATETVKPKFCTIHMDFAHLITHHLIIIRISVFHDNDRIIWYSNTFQSAQISMYSKIKQIFRVILAQLFHWYQSVVIINYNTTILQLNY